MALCYLAAVSANFNIALFEFNDACKQSADELKLHKLERKVTLWVAQGLLYTDTWQYCLSETLDIIYIYGPGSSVGIATDYGLDGPGSNPGGDEIFRLSGLHWGPRSLL